MLFIQKEYFWMGKSNFLIIFKEINEKMLKYFFDPSSPGSKDLIYKHVRSIPIVNSDILNVDLHFIQGKAHWYNQ